VVNVDATGKIVTWVSGDTFSSTWIGMLIYITGGYYQVAHVVSATTLYLTGGPAGPLTGAGYDLDEMRIYGDLTFSANFRPDMSSVPYIFFADWYQMLKDTGALASTQRWGIFAPTRPVTAQLTSPAATIIEEFPVIGDVTTKDVIAPFITGKVGPGATLGTAVAGGQISTVTPTPLGPGGAMTTIQPGALIRVNLGGGTTEDVIVISTTSATFTAYFSYSHLAAESIDETELAGGIAAGTTGTITRAVITPVIDLGQMRYPPFPSGTIAYATGDDRLHFFLQAVVSSGIPITGEVAADPAKFTSVAHGLVDGNTIEISGYTDVDWGAPAGGANGVWTVTVVDADHFWVPLNASPFGASAGAPVWAIVSSSAAGAISKIEISLDVGDGSFTSDFYIRTIDNPASTSVDVQFKDFVAHGLAGEVGHTFWNVTCWRIAITAAVPCTIYLSEFYEHGGSGLDTTGGVKYDYRVTYYNNNTGAESSPSVVMTEENWLDPQRQPVLLSWAASPDSQVTHARPYRRGGVLPSDWYKLTDVPIGTNSYEDRLSDASIVLNKLLEIDNDPPVSSLMSVPVNRVLGGAIVAGAMASVIPGVASKPESLKNGADFAANWGVTGDFAVGAGVATYTDATHIGTLTQLAANQNTPAVGSRWYKFQYDVTANTLAGTPVATITTLYSLAAQPLNLTIAASKVVYFKSAVAPTNFVISITGTTAGAITFDNFSLTEILEDVSNLHQNQYLDVGTGDSYESVIVEATRLTGVVNTVVTTSVVNHVSGQKFSVAWVGKNIQINNATYVVATFVSDVQITVNPDPGTQNNVWYGIDCIYAYFQKAHATTAVISASVRTGKPAMLCASAYGRMWIAGDVDNPYILYYSKRNRPESFPPQNTLEIGNPSDPIMALIEHRGVLLVVTKTTWYYISSPANSVPYYTSTGCRHGLLSHCGWTKTEADIWYKSHGGVYVFHGTDATYASESVEWVMRGKPLGPVIPMYQTTGSEQSVRLAYHNNEIYCSYIGTDFNSYRVVYHLIYDRWRNDQNYDAPNYITSMLLEEDTNTLLIGQSNGMIFADRQALDYDDGGYLAGNPVVIAIATDLQTPYRDQEAPENDKVYEQVTLDLNTHSQNVTVILYFNNGASYPITAATNAAVAELTMVNHCLMTGAVVKIAGFAGAWVPANSSWIATVTGPNTFTIPLNSMTFGAMAGTPVFDLSLTLGTVNTPARSQVKLDINASLGQVDRNISVRLMASVIQVVDFYGFYVKASLDAEWRKSFDTYWIDFNIVGWKSIKQGWFEYTSGADITFAIYQEGSNTSVYTFTLPASGGKKAGVRVKFPTNIAVSKLWRFVATSAGSFKLYPSSYIISCFYIAGEVQKDELIFLPVFGRWGLDQPEGQGHVAGMLLEESTTTLMVGQSNVGSDRQALYYDDAGYTGGGVPIEIPPNVNLQTSYRDQGELEKEKVYEHITLDINTHGQTVAVTLLFNNGDFSIALGIVNNSAREKVQFAINLGLGQLARNIAVKLTASMPAAVEFWGFCVKVTLDAEWRRSYDTYWTDFGMLGWKFAKQGWFEYVSSADITFSAYLEGSATPTYTFTLPSSGGLRAAIRKRLPADEGKLWRFVGISVADFKLYPSSFIEMKPVCADENKGYVKFPLGKLGQ
jgi:hypothetical protein